jgi:4-amino-4-deoxy-L-arabinose transferase-like glycosyltransferase
MAPVGGGASPAIPGRGTAALQRSLGVFVVRHYRLCAGLVLALMACNVFVGLATTRIDDSDEARYGVSAFEMLHTRSFLVTTYAGQPEYWNLKPPLGYWLMAGSYWLFGRSALAMRLPSALFALAAVALTMAFCKRWCNRRQAILAGLLLATAFGFLSHHGARSGDLDACLTFTFLLLVLQLPRLGESPRRILVLGPILGCAFLLKSFAILPMIAVAAAYGLATGAWRKQRLGPCLASLATLLLIVAVWAAARSQADQSFNFVRRMVREDLLARSTSVIDKGTSSPFAYATALADRFAPWPLAVAAAAALAWRDRRRRHAAGTARTAGAAAGGATGTAASDPASAAAGGATGTAAGDPASAASGGAASTASGGATGAASGGAAGGPPARRWLRRRRGREMELLLGLWIAIPLAMFSLARTQHHWYLDPIYPACAILSAAALLFLVRGVPRQLKAAALVAFVAAPLALCEARVLHRVLVRDHMPASQRFLYALEHAAGARCRELRTTFPLRHSERFILEVVDGFRVVEDAAAGTSSDIAAGAPAGIGVVGGAGGPGTRRAALAPGVCVLVSRRPPAGGGRHHRHGAGPPIVPGWALEKQSDAYALFAGGLGTVPIAPPGGAARVPDGPGANRLP